MKLEDLIKQIIEDLKSNKVDNERIDNFINYKNKYTVLRPTVTVKVELTDGKVASIDVSDYFEGVIK